jgi:coatomer subunit epsilon
VIIFYSCSPKPNSVALIVQIYLSINRPDLAKKEFDKCKRWAEDDLLLQLIESTIGLVTGKDTYSDSNAFYTEQLANPSLSSPHLLTARGITRLMKGDVMEAKSDFEESITHQVGRGGVQNAPASDL